MQLPIWPQSTRLALVQMRLNRYNNISQEVLKMLQKNFNYLTSTEKIQIQCTTDFSNQQSKSLFIYTWCCFQQPIRITASSQSIPPRPCTPPPRAHQVIELPALFLVASTQHFGRERERGCALFEIISHLLFFLKQLNELGKPTSWPKAPEEPTCSGNLAEIIHTLFRSMN